MDRDTAISMLKAHEAELRRLGVQHLYLFGSTAREEARIDSDVDLFFDHEWGKLSLFDVMEIQEITTRILGCKTDAMTRASLHPSSPEPRLRDIVDAIGYIRSDLDKVTLESFAGDRQKRWQVERGLEIISEASRHLPEDMKLRHPEIPWRKVAGIGNVLRHEYTRVAADVLWRLVQADLGALDRVCRAELATLPPNQ
jgi:uncharacterized protein with HEPN domain